MTLISKIAGIAAIARNRKPCAPPRLGSSWPGGDEAEQAMRLVGDAGGGKHLVSRSLVWPAGTEQQRPQNVNCPGGFFRVGELGPLNGPGIEWGYSSRD